MLTSNLPLLFIIFYFMFLSIAVVFEMKISTQVAKIINLIFYISIIILSYNFVPDASLDLFRYYEYLDEIRNVGWNNVLTYGGYKNTIITQLYFYLVSILGNYSLLSVVPTAAIFAIIFYVSNKFRKNYNVSFQAFSLFVLGIIAMATLSGIISGIRQNFAWALLMFAVYYDFFKENNNKLVKIILYALPLMVHISSLIYIALRILTPIFNKKSKLMLLLLFSPTSLILVYFVKDYLPFFLYDAVMRLINYTSLNIDLSLKNLTTTIGYLIISFMVYKIRKSHNNFKKYNGFLNYYSSVLVLGFASFFSPVLYVRTFQLIMYLSLPAYSMFLKEKTHYKKASILVLLSLFLLLFYYNDLHSGDPFLR